MGEIAPKYETCGHIVAAAGAQRAAAGFGVSSSFAPPRRGKAAGSGRALRPSIASSFSAVVPSSCASRDILSESLRVDYDGIFWPSFQRLRNDRVHNLVIAEPKAGPGSCHAAVAVTNFSHARAQIESRVSPLALLSESKGW
jgi:hypothetical protein